jgi:hypothetical protein
MSVEIVNRHACGGKPQNGESALPNVVTIDGVSKFVHLSFLPWMVHLRLFDVALGGWAKCARHEICAVKSRIIEPHRETAAVSRKTDRYHRVSGRQMMEV